MQIKELKTDNVDQGAEDNVDEGADQGAEDNVDQGAATNQDRHISTSVFTIYRFRPPKLVRMLLAVSFILQSRRRGRSRGSHVVARCSYLYLLFYNLDPEGIPKDPM